MLSCDVTLPASQANLSLQITMGANLLAVPCQYNVSYNTSELVLFSSPAVRFESNQIFVSVGSLEASRNTTFSFAFAVFFNGSAKVNAKLPVTAVAAFGNQLRNASFSYGVREPR
jgi:hypothetical protein